MSAQGKMLVTLTVDELEGIVERGVRKALEEKPNATKKWIDPDELAAHYGVSRSTVHNWVKRDGCPHQIRGKVLRFDLAAVEAWFGGREPGLRRVK